MPTQAITLALAGSIYPPALAAVIAIARGPELRTRLLAFAIAALLTTFAVGIAILELLDALEIGGTRHQDVSAALQLAIGAALIGVAVYIQRRPRKPNASADGRAESKLERYMSSVPLVLVLGVTLYALPSPQYVGMIKAITDAHLSKGGELIALAVGIAVMLWMIELPVLMLLVFPQRATEVLERVNAWFAERGRTLLLVLLYAAGAYLAVNGFVHLI